MFANYWHNVNLDILNSIPIQIYFLLIFLFLKFCRFLTLALLTTGWNAVIINFRKQYIDYYVIYQMDGFINTQSGPV